MSIWLKDFEFKKDHVYVKATDTILSLNRALIWEVLRWFPFYSLERLRTVKHLFSRQKRPNIAYLPTPPRPWYFLSVITLRAGAQTVSNLAQADAVFYFEDQTKAFSPTLPADIDEKAYNFNCDDISKSRVGEIFAEIFGYSVSVDPKTYSGEIAIKSEKNGAHDGYVQTGPLKTPDPNLVYQRLINNEIEGDYIEDLRCPIIDGDIRIVFIKTRPLKTRFENTNTRVCLADPNMLFSDQERAQLKAFAKAMGLDCGGIDVLRDHDNGQIYVVDVNKTDMGPPIALSLRDKNKATSILTTQFLELIGFSND